MAYARYDAEPQRGFSIITLLTRFTVLLIVVGCLAVIALLFLPVVQRLNLERKAIARLESQIAAAEADLRRERELGTLLTSDPEFVETKARDMMDLMKEGETIFRLESPTPKPSR